MNRNRPFTREETNIHSNQYIILTGNPILLIDNTNITTDNNELIVNLITSITTFLEPWNSDNKPSMKNKPILTILWITRDNNTYNTLILYPTNKHNEVQLMITVPISR